MHVFSMGLFYKLHNLLLAAVCHDISKKIKSLENLQLGSCVSSALDYYRFAYHVTLHFVIFFKKMTREDFDHEARKLLTIDSGAYIHMTSFGINTFKTSFVVQH